MKLVAFIYHHIPEPVKVVFLAGTYFGLSQADIEFAIRSLVGLMTATYIGSKILKIWLKKKGETK